METQNGGLFQKLFPSGLGSFKTDELSAVKDKIDVEVTNRLLENDIKDSVYRCILKSENFDEFIEQSKTYSLLASMPRAQLQEYWDEYWSMYAENQKENETMDEYYTGEFADDFSVKEEDKH